MTQKKMETELILNNRSSQTVGNKPISDDVIIEILPAFKDIFIEFINR